MRLLHSFTITIIMPPKRPFTVTQTAGQKKRQLANSQMPPTHHVPNSQPTVSIPMASNSEVDRSESQLLSVSR